MAREECMSCGRKIRSEESPEEVFLPRQRTVTFEDAASVKVMASRLRLAWVIKPDPSRNYRPDDMEAIGPLLRLPQEKTPEEIQGMRNPDKENLDTPLRKAVAALFEHVFSDVTRWLAGAVGGTGRYTPGHELLVIRYPEEGHGFQDPKAMKKVLEKAFENHVVLVGAYVDPGVRIGIMVGNKRSPGSKSPQPQASRYTPGGPRGQNRIGEPDKSILDGKEELDFYFEMNGPKVGSRDVYDEPEACWVKKSHPVECYIGGNVAGRTGVAAVMVIGPQTEEDEST